MKVYVVAKHFDAEGYSYPEAVFDDLQSARRFAESIKADVFEREMNKPIEDAGHPI